MKHETGKNSLHLTHKRSSVAESGVLFVISHAIALDASNLRFPDFRETAVDFLVLSPSMCEYVCACELLFTPPEMCKPTNTLTKHDFVSFAHVPNLSAPHRSQKNQPTQYKGKTVWW